MNHLTRRTVHYKHDHEAVASLKSNNSTLHSIMSWVTAMCWRDEDKDTHDECELAHVIGTCAVSKKLRNKHTKCMWEHSCLLVSCASVGCWRGWETNTWGTSEHQSACTCFMYSYLSLTDTLQMYRTQLSRQVLSHVLVPFPSCTLWDWGQCNMLITFKTLHLASTCRICHRYATVHTDSIQPSTQDWDYTAAYVHA